MVELGGELDTFWAIGLCDEQASIWVSYMMICDDCIYCTLN